MRLDLRACLVLASASLGCGPAGVGGETAGETAGETSIGSGGTSEDTGGMMDCGTVKIETVFIPTKVMFVVDTSASMLHEWDHDGDPGTPPQSRWASIPATLEAITAAQDCSSSSRPPSPSSRCSRS